MSHQTVAVYVEDEDDFEDRPVSGTPEKTWPIVHHGGSGDKWAEQGIVTVTEPEGAPEAVYLECQIKDQPFLSVLADIDQWGTHYSFMLDSGNGVMRRDEDGSIIYAQEWGRPSFIRALANALLLLAEKAEPDPDEYRKRAEGASHGRD